MSRPQEDYNEDLVWLFKQLIPYAGQDTEKDETSSEDCIKIGKWYVNERRLGHVLRSIKATNE